MANGRLIVVGMVWLVIAFEFSIFSFIFLNEFANQHPTLFWFVFILFLIFSSMTCLCYYKSITTEPGSPSKLINLTYENLDEIKKKSNQEAELKRQIRKLRAASQPHPQFDQIQALTRAGYCNVCEVVKDLRVHHCKLCNKCIIRMDHHCPWIGNCVGKNNHKYFIQFLFYATFGLLIVWSSIIIDWLFGTTLSNIPELFSYPVYLCAVSSLMLDLAIGLLFFSQLNLLRYNMTTLQSFIPGIFWRNPWQKETFGQCVQQIFGSSSIWFPTKPFDLQSYVQIQV